MKKIIILICFALFSCLYPQDSQVSREERSYLVFKGDDKYFSKRYEIPFITKSPLQYKLYLDDLFVGYLYDYEDRSLEVISGTHIIKVKFGKNLILKKKIFVSSGKTREVKID